ncbi:alkene reductase [Blastomonas sp.]|uniref:alkene reductase n=1 Tax=Blastomonas sp. TaxID=1909299 RepID=UPI003593DECC
MPTLFDPIQLGAIACPNRILMAPLTRCRSTKAHAPVPLMGEYYAQRAAAGLIISEATGISQEGLGTPYAPGIWNDEQVEAWKPVIEQVHKAGGRIICQLWHMGRLVHPDFLGGQPPISASATRFDYHAHTYEGTKPYETARALPVNEIPRVIDDYAQATLNAKRAGFDGVQLHAANGYLIDQFIRSSTNLRDDDYGGAVENRIRLLGEVTQRLIEVWAPGQVSVRLSPNGETQGANDATPQETFTAAAALLGSIGIAFLELREPPANGSFGASDVPPVSPHIRKVFSAPLVLNSDYVLDNASAALANDSADAISFGRTFLANPDLPARLAAGAPLTPDNPRRWYGQGPEGYTDYPTLAEQNATVAAQ